MCSVVLSISTTDISATLVTSVGSLTVEVYCDQVPNTAKNFLALAASGAYDGTVFHRNVAGFLVQGGDPSGTGKEGRNFQGGFQADEFRDNLKHDKRGVVSFANLNKPTTVGSQFFVTYAAQASLDNLCTVFGQVTDGWDTLDRMEQVPVAGKKHRPVEDLTIIKVLVTRNPIAEAEAEAEPDS